VGGGQEEGGGERLVSGKPKMKNKKGGWEISQIKPYKNKGRFNKEEKGRGNAANRRA